MYTFVVTIESKNDTSTGPDVHGPFIDHKSAMDYAKSIRNEYPCCDITVCPLIRPKV